MITEQKLKERCTQEIIEKMVELAEGFKSHGDPFRDALVVSIDFPVNEIMIDFNNLNNSSIFPLLLYRAVEGWNDLNICKPIQVLVNCVMWITDKDNPVSVEYGYENYQPTTLTQAECAMLHCLLEVLK